RRTCRAGAAASWSGGPPPEPRRARPRWWRWWSGRWPRARRRPGRSGATRAAGSPDPRGWRGCAAESAAISTAHPSVWGFWLLHLGEGGGDRVLLPVPHICDLNLLTRFETSDLPDDVISALDGPAVDLGDEVGDLQPSLLRRASRGDLPDQRAGHAAGGVGDAHAQERVGHLPGTDELVGHVLGRVDRDGEAEPDAAAAARRGDRRVDAHDLPCGVDQRAPGVARVDRGVGLDGSAD